MKKISLIAALLCVTFMYSQEGKYNNFSLEAAYGLNHPITPNDNSGFAADSFSEFKHFDIGGRYMVNLYYGFKLSYAYDRFQYANTSELAVTYNRIGVDAVFSLSEILNISFSRNRNVQIQAHTGVGITFAQPKSISKVEKIGNFSIGITPKFKISKRVALTTDLSYIVNFKQHYNYGGILIDPEYNSVTGGYINFTVGLNVYFGKRRDHADWY